MISLKVKKEQDGKELLELLELVYPDFSPKALKAAFKAGDITLNGEEAYSDDEIQKGDIVRMFVSGDVAGTDLTPRVVYQDENFLIADKPSGLLSVSDKGEPNATKMAEKLMENRGELCLDALMVPYLVYPLEKYVSGLLLFGKNEQAYLFLVEALAQRRITRYYVCPVGGRTKVEDELIACLIHNKQSKRVRILDEHQKNAKPIVTRYTLLSRGEDMSLVKVRPVTNYLHQIRAHLAYKGLPVLGDRIYGDRYFNRSFGAERIALWLQTIVFETGTSHEFAYINGKQFKSKTMSFPKSVYDAGLLEI